MRWVGRLPKPARKAAFTGYRLAFHAMTLGVRVMAHDGGRVLLVRHTYVPDWHLPGGGVERGETVEQAALKELSEETHLTPTGALVLRSFHRNGRHSRYDHVAFFELDAFAEGAPFRPNGEIAECRFFDLDALPEGLDRSSRARIEEVRTGRAAHPDW